jgi:hypothetical protein
MTGEEPQNGHHADDQRGRRVAPDDADPGEAQHVGFVPPPPRTHVLPVLGATHLPQVTAGHLNSLYLSLLGSGHHNGSTGLAPKTVRNIYVAVTDYATGALPKEGL